MRARGDLTEGAVRLPATLRCEQRDEVAVLTLARPEKRNALDDETVRGLEAFFDRPPAGVKAVVLAAEGEHFSAGLDLSELTERDAAEGILHSRMWHRAFERIEFGQLPVIAALHGAVIGGGLELACAAHIRVAEPSTYYGLPEGQRGIFVGGGGSVRLPRLIGVSRMMDMMLTGRTYDAGEGQRLGLSHYLVAEGEGCDRALALARRIAGNAPLSNFAILQALPRIAEGGAEAGYLAESLMAAIAQTEPEAKARLQDFLAKRAPKVGRE